MKLKVMQKLTKTIAAIILTIAIVCAAGCKKDNVGNGTYNGHDYIDLGLPSGTLWATCNVGAETPEEYGDYFAWGETQSKDAYIPPRTTNDERLVVPETTMPEASPPHMKR